MRVENSDLMVGGVPQLFPGTRTAKLDFNAVVRGLYGGLVSEHDGGPGKLLGFLVPFVAVVGGGFVVVAGPGYSANIVVVPVHHGLSEIEIVAGERLGKLVNAEHLKGKKSLIEKVSFKRSKES